MAGSGGSQQPLGAIVQITTADREVHTGELFWYDVKAAGLLLRKKKKVENQEEEEENFIWISDEYVTNATALVRPPAVPTTLPAVDLSAVEARLKERLKDVLGDTVAEEASGGQVEPAGAGATSATDGIENEDVLEEKNAKVDSGAASSSSTVDETEKQENIDRDQDGEDKPLAPAPKRNE